MSLQGFVLSMVVPSWVELGDRDGKREKHDRIIKQTEKRFLKQQVLLNRGMNSCWQLAHRAHSARR